LAHQGRFRQSERRGEHRKGNVSAVNGTFTFALPVFRFWRDTDDFQAKI